MQPTAVTTAVTTYAATVNARFHKSKSQYVDLQTRLQNALKNFPVKQSLITEAINEFQLRNPQIQQRKNAALCQADKTTLDKIVIDVTLQRELDVTHVSRIISEFKAIRVMPISVYEDASLPGKFVCWDGQHTVIALYTIFCYLLKEDPRYIEVPIVVYPSDQKCEMRENFVSLNGDAKLPLLPVDLFFQMIYGVRTDGSTNSEWILAEEKQQLLEQAGMFATHSKYQDDTKAGALTVMTEFLNTDYSIETTKAFCSYFKAVCGSNRPVQPKESWMLYDYFDMCLTAGIVLDDAYINAVAAALQVVNGNDFNASIMYSQAKLSYQEWYRANKPNPDGTLSGISYSEKRIGQTFLVAQIAKAGVKVPKYRQAMWTVPASDLF